MIHPIVLYDNNILRQKSEIVKINFTKLDDLIKDMYETMLKANGIGLSAIQISVPLRIFVIEAHIEKENFHFKQTFINPTIIRKYGNNINYSEGCLSIPYISAMVSRTESIEIEYWDEKWERHLENYSDYKARIIQHEYDHLEGVLYIDKVDNLWKQVLEEPLLCIKKKDVTPKYLFK